MSWEDEHQHFEKDWWGNCANTLGEEIKQLTYAEKMGLKWFHNGKSPYNIDCHNQAILDIGGGPVSMLLKCENLLRGMVVDPCEYPRWIGYRYDEANIAYGKFKGEDLDQPLPEELGLFDETWIYNVLQHVEDPEKIIRNAQKASRLIRIFEWIDNGVSPGHPHDLKESKLNKWLKGEGKVEVLDLPQLRGKAYYGVFPT